MGRLSPSLSSQDTPLRSTSLAPKSTRRGPHRRVHGPGRRPLKTGGLRHNADDAPS